MAFGSSDLKKIIKNRIVLYWLQLLLTTFIFNFGFAQSTEEKIYVAIELFTANPTPKNLQKLVAFEKINAPKNKPELLAVVILNCNKAYYQNKFGATQSAISSFEKAWYLYNKNKLQNYDIIEFCLKPLGNLYAQIGDFENAENTIKNYFFLANNANNETQKVSAIQNLSAVYYSCGKNNEAITLLQNELKTPNLSATQKGNLLANLAANLLAIKQINKSKLIYLKSIELLKSDQFGTTTLANSYRNLSKIYVLTNNFAQANSYFAQAKALLKTATQFTARDQLKLDLEEANLLFEQDKIEESQWVLNKLLKNALPNYNSTQTIPELNTLYAETLLLDAFDLQGALFTAQNKYKKALEWFDLSFWVEQLLQSTVVYENSKIISQNNNHNRVEKCIALNELLYKKELKTTYLHNAFLLSEQYKSLVLKTAVYANNLKSNAEKALSQSIQNQSNIIINEQQKGTTANIEIINKAIQKQNELMLLLKLKTKKSTATLNQFSLLSVFKKLQIDNAMMVTYFCGTEKTYCFVLNNGQLEMKVIENIQPKIKSLLTYFSNSDKILDNVAGFTTASNQLYKCLQMPQLSNNKSLIIIPDGLLNFVPFEALLTKLSTATNFEKMPFLIRDYQVSYQNSVLFYLDTKADAYLKKNKKVLALFPVFEKTDYELMYSKNEMDAIKLNFRGTFLEKNKATFKNFKQLAPHYSILHLCTHAASGSIDEPASIQFYDRTVRYSEFYTLDIKPNLVVLSACETGLGKLYKAEGAMSISRGFQMAGAKNILFSLWKVNDYTTSVFMEKFYTFLNKNESFAQANHDAKISFLADKTISNSKKSPYYWCSMVYYGTINATTAPNYNWVYIVLGLFMVVIGIFLYKKRLSFLKAS